MLETTALLVKNIGCNNWEEHFAPQFLSTTGEKPKKECLAVE